MASSVELADDDQPANQRHSMSSEIRSEQVPEQCHDASAERSRRRGGVSCERDENLSQ